MFLVVKSVEKRCLAATNVSRFATSKFIRLPAENILEQDFQVQPLG